MELSNADSLRLHVLLAQSLHALRIDESRMIVHALSETGEAKVFLNPTCKDEIYLRLVRQLLSSHVLGSPGGYPVYLKRWTRMGQARDESLEKLLLLGEPEAVIAVVHARGLTDELARRAWWASPTAENARRMLENQCVAKGDMGPVLAQYLLEFLPFEDDPLTVIDSVRLVLQPGLIDTAQRDQLWTRGIRQNTYHVGFLCATPSDLPVRVCPHRERAEVRHRLEKLIAVANPYAVLLCATLGSSGQAFLNTAEKVLRKPVNQDVVVALLEAVASYFRSVKTDQKRRRDINVVLRDATHLCEAAFTGPSALSDVLKTVPEWREQVRGMLILAMISEQLVAPIFGLTDAVGSVMRQKIKHVTTPILDQFALLQAGARP